MLRLHVIRDDSRELPRKSTRGIFTFTLQDCSDLGMSDLLGVYVDQCRDSVTLERQADEAFYAVVKTHKRW